mmetsp:Transcript_20243/g.51708  ORF Transcript_20243/g.51708 Transcript_20243/m.51708 type:complete len:245 (+) Transcript_20243:415-1149(+)
MPEGTLPRAGRPRPAIEAQFALVPCQQPAGEFLALGVLILDLDRLADHGEAALGREDEGRGDAGALMGGVDREQTPVAATLRGPARAEGRARATDQLLSQVGQVQHTVGTRTGVPHLKTVYRVVAVHSLVFADAGVRRVYDRGDALNEPRHLDMLGGAHDDEDLGPVPRKTHDASVRGSGSCGPIRAEGLLVDLLRSLAERLLDLGELRLEHHEPLLVLRLASAPSSPSHGCEHRTPGECSHDP